MISIFAVTGKVTVTIIMRISMVRPSNDEDVRGSGDSVRIDLSLARKIMNNDFIWLDLVCGSARFYSNMVLSCCNVRT